MCIGTVGHGWQQVANELVYERSGPDRWTSTYHLLAGMVDKLHAHPTEARRSAIARLVVRLWTMHQMSSSIAGMLEEGRVPNTEAALAKDLGTRFDQVIPEAAQSLFGGEFSASLDVADLFYETVR